MVCGLGCWYVPAGLLVCCTEPKLEVGCKGPNCWPGCNNGVACNSTLLAWLGCWAGVVAFGFCTGPVTALVSMFQKNNKAKEGWILFDKGDGREDLLVCLTSVLAGLYITVRKGIKPS